MSTIRQDAWSGDDDLILAEVVLRHIREGSTQLAAFEEVGKKLSRTSAACGFRWNSTIRKKYEAAIALAKKQRTMEKKTAKTTEANDEPSLSEEQEVNEAPSMEQVHSPEVSKNDSLTMEQVLAFLTEYHRNEQGKVDSTVIEKLEKENARLKEELEKERAKNQVIANDYRTLVSIMDRARNMSFYDHVSGS